MWLELESHRTMALCMYKVIFYLGFLVTFGSSQYRYNRRPPPTFGLTPSEVLSRVGQPVQLPCPVYNLGPYTVIWRRVDLERPISVGEHVYATDSQFSVERSHSGEMINYHLVISSFTNNEVGSYYCETSYPSPRPQPSPTIRLAVAPSIAFVSIQSGGDFIEGMVLSLECRAMPGYRGPLGWSKDGQRLVTNEQAGLSISQEEDTGYGATSSLTISRAQLSDSGTYSCESRNSEYAQSISREIQVVVQPQGEVVHPDHEEELNQMSGS